MPPSGRWTLWRNGGWPGRRGSGATPADSRRLVRQLHPDRPIGRIRPRRRGRPSPMPGTFLPAKDGRHRVPTTYDQQYPYPDGKPWLSPFPYPKVIGHTTSYCHHHDFRGKTWRSALTDVRFWPVGLLPERGSSPSAPPVGFWRHVAPGPAPKHQPVPVLTPTESRPPLPSPVGN